jgi:hypothetical protein
MCTVIISTGERPDWPLLLAANRDELLDRPWQAPAAHWPDQPDVVGGLDTFAGGTWLAVNSGGVVAAVLNRTGTLGPAPGKRSRGELPLLALRHADAASAAHAIAALNAEAWRSFNLVVADRRHAYFVRGAGHGRIVAHLLVPGTHITTASDPDDLSSPRIARYLPQFLNARRPSPPEWSGWTKLLQDGSKPADTALNIAPHDGFGTVTSTLIALGRRSLFLATAGAPGATPYEPVPWAAPSS